MSKLANISNFVRMLLHNAYFHVKIYSSSPYGLRLGQNCMIHLTLLFHIRLIILNRLMSISQGLAFTLPLDRNKLRGFKT